MIDEQVLVAPREQIVIKGTKTPPTVPTGKFIWPTKGGYITSGYGMRRGKAHPAIDISGVSDRTIMAADNGKVIFAGRDGGYGNLVKISHGNGYVTWYAHLSSISVSVGQQVAKGQKIGVMGETGNATGVHLHYEIHLNGKALNPEKFY
ncbi:MAG: putative peptidase [Candidatus Carbobacillus altaicus]|uniref:Putative peptidase n=1 Tax=Candidatus Carbonibacillus altaicus TaxID=2163959 RepID=A0A2R6XXD9_9BACL|nr:MAG: putative peptidase [Candidatus Carbobacillus altaicus]